MVRGRIGPRVEFRLTDAQIVTIKQIARDYGVTEAEVVRRLLQFSIDKCMERRAGRLSLERAGT